MVKEAKAKMAKGDKKGACGKDNPAIRFVEHIGLGGVGDGNCSLTRPLFIFYHRSCYVLFNLYSKWQIVGALFAMKRKKLYEQEVDKIQNVKFTLETQVMNLESASQNAQTYKALQQGTKTMQKIRTDVGIEQVDDVMDQIKEEMELAQEINQAISQPVDPLMMDEDELFAELNALETADLEAELLKPPASAVSPLSMPAAPASKLPALKQKEQDDLKQLEAELAGL
jgi:Snf7